MRQPRGLSYAVEKKSQSVEFFGGAEFPEDLAEDAEVKVRLSGLNRCIRDWRAFFFFGGSGGTPFLEPIVRDSNSRWSGGVTQKLCEALDIARGGAMLVRFQRRLGDRGHS